MLLFNDLYDCFYEQPNIAELKKLFNKFIFELDDKANDKLLLNAQKRRHLRKKNMLPRDILCLIVLYVVLRFKIFLVICSLEWLNSESSFF